MFEKSLTTAPFVNKIDYMTTWKFIQNLMHKNKNAKMQPMPKPTIYFKAEEALDMVVWPRFVVKSNSTPSPISRKTGFISVIILCNFEILRNTFAYHPDLF